MLRRDENNHRYAHNQTYKIASREQKNATDITLTFFALMEDTTT
jgi:hypothetical protein